MFSAALCRGLIEASHCRLSGRRHGPFSAALCRGLIEAAGRGRAGVASAKPFSAALCRGLIEAYCAGSRARPRSRRFSAALCRGLIEALRLARAVVRLDDRFPRLYAAASLKLGVAVPVDAVEGGVFRGFMPRPH